MALATEKVIPLPRKSFGFLPTPLIRLHNLEKLLGDGYGIVGDLERQAIGLTVKYEGILLDPVYTGRAMGGMPDMIRRGRFSTGDTVLFWHTGGTLALFSGERLF